MFSYETEIAESPEVEVVTAPVNALNDKAVKYALLAEFPELWECHKVDLRPLWTRNGVSHYRLNGWSRGDGDGIIFSRFVKAWMEESGVQYEIIT